MRPWIWMLAVATTATLAPTAPARADSRDELLTYVLIDAQRDFEAVRGESALSGTAPLPGLKGTSKPKAKSPGKRNLYSAAMKPAPDAERLTESEAPSKAQTLARP